MTGKERDELARRVHQAMQDAPHDGQPYRQARAAIRAMLDPSEADGGGEKSADDDESEA